MTKMSFNAALAVAFLFSSRPALAESVSLLAPLDTPSVSANTFTTTVTALGFSDTDTITYEGQLQPKLDIDFTDFANPVVNSLDFLGQPGDIVHSAGSFDFGILGSVSLAGIQGRIETPVANQPAPVTSGMFSSDDHEIIFAQGTITVSPSIGSPTVVDLNTNPLIRTLGGINDSTVTVTLAGVAGGIATYDVEILTPLDMVTVQTGDPQIDALVQITIDGNLVASGQFPRAIPEPGSFALAGCVACFAALRRR
ncbi:MAG: hypothetical protein AAGA92_13970 [Planctomycetota bacterium]